eukprot:gene12618-biopygen11010
MASIVHNSAAAHARGANECMRSVVSRVSLCFTGTPRHAATSLRCIPRHHVWSARGIQYETREPTAIRHERCGKPSQTLPTQGGTAADACGTHPLLQSLLCGTRPQLFSLLLGLICYAFHFETGAGDAALHWRLEQKEWCCNSAQRAVHAREKVALDQPGETARPVRVRFFASYRAARDRSALGVPTLPKILGLGETTTDDPLQGIL